MLKTFIRLFFPHHSNNHRSKLLHHQSLLFLIGLLFLSNAALQLIQLKAPQILGFASQIPPQRIIELTNQNRTAFGLPALVLNERLSDAARRKAAHMFTKNYWAHNSPDGTKPWSFILAAGYDYLHAGENLARDFNNSESIVEAWMNSPSHRDNLLNPRYVDIGVAVVDGQLTGGETTLVVQMFGTPQTSAPQVSSDSNNTSTLVLSEIVTVASAATPSEEVISRFNDVPTESTFPLFDTFQVARSISLAFAFLIMLTLAVDWLIAWQKNLIRISGRSWAHLTFFGFIAILLIIIKQGLIL